MRVVLFFLIICCNPIALLAQKPSLDIAAIDNWPGISNEQISNDGNWVLYRVGHGNQKDTLVIQGTDRKWQLKIPGGDNAVFTTDSRFIIYQQNDSALIYETRKQRLNAVIPGIISFKVPPDGNGRWMAYQTKFAEKKLVLHDLVDGKDKVYDNVMYYQFSDNGEVMLLLCSGMDEKDEALTVEWIDLATGNSTTIMRQCQNGRNFAFDGAAEQLAFICNEQKDGQSVNTLCYYRKGMDSAVVRVNNMTPGMTRDYSVADHLPKFSPNGQRLLFFIKAPAKSKSRLPNAADVDVWHYNDDYLQTEQIARLGFLNSRTYTCAIGKDDNKLVQLDQETDDSFINLADDGSSDFVLTKQSVNYYNQWKASQVPSYYVINIRTGARKFVISQKELTIGISPTGKYVVWFDPIKQSYFTYETNTSIIKNITRQVNPLISLLPSYQAVRLRPFMPFGLAGWLDHDSSVLIYDQYDIWKIDPAGNRLPVNLTNGYGRRNNIMFRIWQGNDDYAVPEMKTKEIILVAFHLENKNNGFFKKVLANAGDPEKLTLDPYLYYAHKRFAFQFLQSGPIKKARYADVYLLRRMSSKEYPNLFVTRDFKKFEELSQLHPQEDYNWLSTGIVSWKQPDGTLSSGVLYKPENFDPQKKYPVIFYFYEKLSHRLNQFLDPELSGGSINIPYYVSNGYLVFTPDINYFPGMPGEGIYNSVVTAARYLSTIPWIDSTRMGLQGHSFGGYEVNYLVSHSTMFAAAQESSGASDFISYYNGFYRESSAQSYFEFGQGRIGSTLWERPDLYIKNSPIFQADKVETPLLIMHNKEDGEVPFQQGLEWFTALRRLNKRAWMLQYDKEYHGISQRKDQLDFTIRTKQFFDHYLKGEPGPKWMSEGLPAIFKGIESRLELQ